MALNYLIPCRLLLFWFKRKAFLACQQFLWKWNSRWEGIKQARETSWPTNGSHLTLLQSIQRKNFLRTLLPLYLRGGVNNSSLAWNLTDKRFHQTPLEQQQRTHSQQSSVLQGATSSPPTFTTVGENFGQNLQSSVWQNQGSTIAEEGSDQCDVNSVSSMKS